MNTLLKLAAFVMSSVLLYAQGTAGNITGQVLGPAGLGVPAAHVIATNLAANVAISTTSSTGSGQSRTYNATLDGIAITTNRPVEANEIAYDALSLEAITEFGNGLKLYW